LPILLVIAIMLMSLLSTTLCTTEKNYHYRFTITASFPGNERYEASSAETSVTVKDNYITLIIVLAVVIGAIVVLALYFLQKRMPMLGFSKLFKRPKRDDRVTMLHREGENMLTMTLRGEKNFTFKVPIFPGMGRSSRAKVVKTSASHWLRDAAKLQQK